MLHVNSYIRLPNCIGLLQLCDISFWLKLIWSLLPGSFLPAHAREPGNEARGGGFEGFARTPFWPPKDTTTQQQLYILSVLPFQVVH